MFFGFFYFSVSVLVCPAGEIVVGPIGSQFFIPSNEYFNCGEISKVTILDGINRIGAFSFADCGLLSSVSFPSSLRVIESGSFRGCLSLTSVSFPEGLTDILSSAFQHCNLVSVHLSSTIRNIEFLAFQNNANLNQITDSGSNYCYQHDGVMIILGKTIVFCSNYVSQVNFPPNVDTIGTHSFCYCSLISTLTIPNQIVFIDIRGIYGCSMLLTVNIGAGLTDFSNDAFENCFSLASITVDPSNLKYESNANILYTKGSKTMVLYPTGLSYTNLQIPVETTDFEAFCFSGANVIQSFTVPPGHPTFLSNPLENKGLIYSIDKTVLYRIPPGLTITTLELLPEVKHIYKGAGVTCLFSALTFPPQLEFIGDFAFRNTPFESVFIPKTVKFIGKSAFQLTLMKNVIFEAGITLESLADSCFRNSLISNLQLPDSIILLKEHCFQTSTELKTVKLPLNLREIAIEAFQGCSALEAIEFPDSLVNIGNNAFANCISIKAIIIPFRTREIGRYGFGLCTGIKTAVLENCATKFYDDTFEGIENLTRTCIATKQFTPKTKKLMHKSFTSLLFFLSPNVRTFL